VATGPGRDRPASPATAPVGIADLLPRPLPARGALSVWDHGPGGERQVCQAWPGDYGHSTHFAESGPEVGIEPAVAVAAVPPRLSSCRSPAPTPVGTGSDFWRSPGGGPWATVARLNGTSALPLRPPPRAPPEELRTELRDRSRSYRERAEGHQARMPASSHRRRLRWRRVPEADPDGRCGRSSLERDATYWESVGRTTWLAVSHGANEPGQTLPHAPGCGQQSSLEDLLHHPCKL